MSNFLKLTTFLFLLLWTTSITQGQSTIDFENLGLQEGDQIFDQYDDGGPCGVRFYLGDPSLNVHPTLARIGYPGVAFVGPYNSQPPCNAFSGTDDMPDPSAGVGCWFLTDDGILSASADELRVLYNSPTFQCSGDLIDIDGVEIWTIEAYFQGNLVASQVFTQANATPGDGMATPWQFNLSQPLDELRFSVVKPDGQGIGIAFDNFSACSIREETCCPGRNLITNGDFELGNNGFFSSYDYDPTIGLHSILQNEYTITNSNGAGTISQCWQVDDPASCDKSGNFMVINGNTGTTSAQAVWATQLFVNPNTTYQFCASFKNLPNCCFDKEPEVTILLGNHSPITQTISTSSDPCDWQTVVQTFNSGSASAISIVILLDDALGWDGNDLAIDEISLKEIPQVPASQVAFSANATPDPSDPLTFFNVTASPLFTPGADCDYFWEVCELDVFGNCIPNTTVINPVPWQTIPTDFPGYDGTSTLNGSNPGQFDYNKSYRIVYGMSCACESENRSAWIYEPRSGLRTMGTSYYMGYERDTNGDYHFVKKTGENGENSETNEIALEVIPNPASQRATVNYQLEQDELVTLQLLDPTGKVVYENPAQEETMGHHQKELQLGDFPSGVYLVRMEIGNRTLVQRLIIQH